MMILLCVVFVQWIFVVYFFHFFFFKHKTAYEMRISDWSSDVCSSDLMFQARGERRCGDARTGPQVVVSAQAQRKIPDQQQSPSVADQLECSQFGRASCRERVCQYV